MGASASKWYWADPKANTGCDQVTKLRKNAREEEETRKDGELEMKTDKCWADKLVGKKVIAGFVIDKNVLLQSYHYILMTLTVKARTSPECTSRATAACTFLGRFSWTVGSTMIS